MTAPSGYGFGCPDVMQRFCPRIAPSPPPAPPKNLQVDPSLGDAVLIRFLDGGQRPELADAAAERPLADSESGEDEEGVSGGDSNFDSSSEDEGVKCESSPTMSPVHVHWPHDATASRQPADQRKTDHQPHPEELQSLACAALTVTPSSASSPEFGRDQYDLDRHRNMMTNPQETHKSEYHSPEPFRNEGPGSEAHTPRMSPSALAINRPPLPYQPDKPLQGLSSVTPRPPSVLALSKPQIPLLGSKECPPPSPRLDDYKMSSELSPKAAALPPMQPPSKASNQPLPSIQTLGVLVAQPVAISGQSVFAESQGYQVSSPLGNGPFPLSPPGGAPRAMALPRVTEVHASPPTSPNNIYSQSVPSPVRAVHPAGLLSSTVFPNSQGKGGISGNGPGNGNENGNGNGHRNPLRSNLDSSSSSVETPSSEPVSTPSSTSAPERLSIDSITNPLQGTFRCNVPGCNAPAFQTQYLLNSHANVHSSARPHYCPVKGCTRSEGGRGFKRKNEMIRHGLVHDSPGYVCPFCHDREHKYPRPDNLQRHVRVHHVDKDKEDPLLRDVLAQRPDGPNRGRRRRGLS